MLDGDKKDSPVDDILEDVLDGDKKDGPVDDILEDVLDGDKKDSPVDDILEDVLDGDKGNKKIDFSDTFKNIDDFNVSSQDDLAKNIISKNADDAVEVVVKNTDKVDDIFNVAGKTASKKGVGKILSKGGNLLKGANNFLGKTGFANLAVSAGFGFGMSGGSDLGGVIGKKIGGEKGESVGKFFGGAGGLAAAGIGMAIGGPVGALVGGAITKGVGLITKKIDEKKQEKIQEAYAEKDKISQEIQNLKSNESKVQRYDELVKGIGSKGQNLSLSDAEYQEFLGLSNDLATAFPDLVSYIDENGNAFLGLNGIIGEFGEHLKKTIKEKEKEEAEKTLGKDYQDGVKEKIDGLKKADKIKKDNLKAWDDGDIFVTSPDKSRNDGNYTGDAANIVNLGAQKQTIEKLKDEKIQGKNVHDLIYNYSANDMWLTLGELRQMGRDLFPDSQMTDDEMEDYMYGLLSDKVEKVRDDSKKKVENKSNKQITEEEKKSRDALAETKKQIVVASAPDNLDKDTEDAVKGIMKGATEGVHYNYGSHDDFLNDSKRLVADSTKKENRDILLNIDKLKNISKEETVEGYKNKKKELKEDMAEQLKKEGNNSYVDTILRQANFTVEEDTGTIYDSSGKSWGTGIDQFINNGGLDFAIDKLAGNSAIEELEKKTMDVFLNNGGRGVSEDLNNDFKNTISNMSLRDLQNFSKLSEDEQEQIVKNIIDNKDTSGFVSEIQKIGENKISDIKDNFSLNLKKDLNVENLSSSDIDSFVEALENGNTQFQDSTGTMRDISNETKNTWERAKEVADKMGISAKDLLSASSGFGHIGVDGVSTLGYKEAKTKIEQYDNVLTNMRSGNLDLEGIKSLDSNLWSNAIISAVTNGTSMSSELNSMIGQYQSDFYSKESLKSIAANEVRNDANIAREALEQMKYANNNQDIGFSVTTLGSYENAIRQATGETNYTIDQTLDVDTSKKSVSDYMSQWEKNYKKIEGNEGHTTDQFYDFVISNYGNENHKKGYADKNGDNTYSKDEAGSAKSDIVHDILSNMLNNSNNPQIMKDFTEKATGILADGIEEEYKNARKKAMWQAWRGIQDQEHSLSEMAEDNARQKKQIERQRKALPRQIAQVQQQIDNIPMERDAINRNIERNEMQSKKIQRQIDNHPYEVAKIERQIAKTQRERLKIEREISRLPRERTKIERNILKNQRERLKIEREISKLPRERAKIERSIERNQRERKNLLKQDKEIDAQARLNELTDFLERRNLIISEYNSRISLMDWANENLAEGDIAGKIDIGEDKFDALIEKQSKLKEQYNELLGKNPQTAAEAQAISDQMKNITSELLETQKTIYSTQDSLSLLPFQSLSNMLDSSYSSIDKQEASINRAVKINSSFSNIDSGFNMMSINYMDSNKNETEIERKRREYEELIKMQQEFEEKTLEMHTLYLDKKKEEDSEDIADQKEELQWSLDDNAEALIDLNESLEDLSFRAEELQWSLEENAESAEELQWSLEDLEDQELDLKDQLADNEDSERTLKEQLEDMPDTLRELEMSLQDNADANTKLYQSLNQLTWQEMDLRDQLASLNEQDEIYLDQLNDLDYNYKKAKDELALARIDFYNEYSDLIKELATSDNGLAQFLTNFKGDVGQLVEEVARYFGINLVNDTTISPKISTDPPKTPSPIYTNPFETPKTPLPSWDYSKYSFKAKGTNYFTGSEAVVGDENLLKGNNNPSPELAIYPNGTLELLGMSGAEIRKIPTGTTILTTKQTKDFFKNVPNFAGGYNNTNLFTPYMSPYVQNKLNQANNTKNTIFNPFYTSNKTNNNSTGTFKDVTDGIKEAIRQQLETAIKEAIEGFDPASVVNATNIYGENGVIYKLLNELVVQFESLEENIDELKKVQVNLGSLVDFDIKGFEKIGTDAASAIKTSFKNTLSAIVEVVGEDGSKVEETEISQIFKSAFDITAISNAIIEQLKLSMESVTKAWKETIITNPEYQLAKINLAETWGNDVSTENSLAKTMNDSLISIITNVIKNWEEVIITNDDYKIEKPNLHSNWGSDINTENSLGKDMNSSIDKSLASSIKNYEDNIRTDDDYKLEKPLLLYDESSKDGWSKEGLVKDIDNQLKAVYKKINSDEYEYKLNAPEPNQEKWEEFGEVIAEYISTGIENGILKAEALEVKSKVTVPDGGGNQTVPQVKTGSGEDVLKQLHNGERKTSAYGWRIRPNYGTKQFHSGVDYGGLPQGTPVLSTTGGTITYAGSRGSYGNLICVTDDNGYVHYYAHNSKFLKKVGDKVNQGDAIAEVGSTGNSTGAHIHYEIRKPNGGGHIDPNSYYIDSSLAGNGIRISQEDMDKNPLLKLIGKKYGLNMNQIEDLNGNIGFISRKYESKGNGGAVNPDTNGPSYGVHQFNRGSGTADSFVAWLKIKDPNMAGLFGNYKAGSVGFNNAWKSTYNKYGEDFTQKQIEYAILDYYTPFREKVLKNYGVDLSRSIALQELGFSHAIQYGSRNTKRFAGINNTMSDADIINLVYNNKLNNVSNDFEKKYQAGVRNRFLDERQDILNLVSYSEGTNYHKGGKALVGDEKLLQGSNKPSPELVIYPNGKTELVGQNGAEIRDLPIGTQVLNTTQTTHLFKNIPSYAEGTTFKHSGVNDEGMKPYIEKIIKYLKTLSNYKDKSEEDLTMVAKQFLDSNIFGQDLLEVVKEMKKNWETSKHGLTTEDISGIYKMFVQTDPNLSKDKQSDLINTMDNLVNSGADSEGMKPYVSKIVSYLKSLYQYSTVDDASLEKIAKQFLDSNIFGQDLLEVVKEMKKEGKTSEHGLTIRDIAEIYKVFVQTDPNLSKDKQSNLINTMGSVLDNDYETYRGQLVINGVVADAQSSKFNDIIVAKMDELKKDEKYKDVDEKVLRTIAEQWFTENVLFNIVGTKGSQNQAKHVANIDNAQKALESIKKGEYTVAGSNKTISMSEHIISELGVGDLYKKKKTIKNNEIKDILIPIDDETNDFLDNYREKIYSDIKLYDEYKNKTDNELKNIASEHIDELINKDYEGIFELVKEMNTTGKRTWNGLTKTDLQTIANKLLDMDTTKTVEEKLILQDKNWNESEKTPDEIRSERIAALEQKYSDELDQVNSYRYNKSQYYLDMFQDDINERKANISDYTERVRYNNTINRVISGDDLNAYYMEAGVQTRLRDDLVEEWKKAKQDGASSAVLKTLEETIDKVNNRIESLSESIDNWVNNQAQYIMATLELVESMNDHRETILNSKYNLGGLGKKTDANYYDLLNSDIVKEKQEIERAIFSHQQNIILARTMAKDSEEAIQSYLEHDETNRKLQEKLLNVLEQQKKIESEKYMQKLNDIDNKLDNINKKYSAVGDFSTEKILTDTFGDGGKLSLTVSKIHDLYDYVTKNESYLNPEEKEKYYTDIRDYIQQLYTDWGTTINSVKEIKSTRYKHDLSMIEKKESIGMTSKRNISDYENSIKNLLDSGTTFREDNGNIFTTFSGVKGEGIFNLPDDMNSSEFMELLEDIKKGKYNADYWESNIKLIKSEKDNIKQSIADRKEELESYADMMNLSDSLKEDLFKTDSVLTGYEEELLGLNAEINQQYQDQLTYKLSVLDIEKAILDLQKPENFVSIKQIDEYYNESINILQKRLDNYLEYFKQAEYMSKEEYETKKKETMELEKQIEYEEKLAKLQAYQNLYSTQYEAMRYMVSEYTGALEEEKETITDVYDEEIKKLEIVNKSKERSIQLTELQTALDNAKKEKKRVYRAGIGFVYEENREEIKKAEDELDNFYKEDRLSSMNDAKELELKYLDERIEGWNKYLEAIEKVFKTAERQHNIKILEELWSVSDWDGIYKFLNSDKNIYLKEEESGNNIYFGQLTSFLEDNTKNSEEIYTLMESSQNILKRIEEKIPAFKNSEDVNNKTGYGYNTEEFKNIFGMNVDPNYFDPNTLTEEQRWDWKTFEGRDFSADASRLTPEEISQIYGDWHNSDTIEAFHFAKLADGERLMNSLGGGIDGINTLISMINDESLNTTGYKKSTLKDFVEYALNNLVSSGDLTYEEKDFVWNKIKEPVVGTSSALPTEEKLMVEFLSESGVNWKYLKDNSKDFIEVMHLAQNGFDFYDKDGKFNVSHKNVRGTYDISGNKILKELSNNENSWLHGIIKSNFMYSKTPEDAFNWISSKQYEEELIKPQEATYKSILRSYSKSILEGVLSGAIENNTGYSLASIQAAYDMRDNKEYLPDLSNIYSSIPEMTGLLYSALIGETNDFGLSSSVIAEQMLSNYTKLANDVESEFLNDASVSKDIDSLIHSLIAEGKETYTYKGIELYISDLIRLRNTKIDKRTDLKDIEKNELKNREYKIGDKIYEANKKNQGVSNSEKHINNAYKLDGTADSIQHNLVQYFKDMRNSGVDFSKLYETGEYKDRNISETNIKELVKYQEMSDLLNNETDILGLIRRLNKRGETSYGSLSIEDLIKLRNYKIDNMDITDKEKEEYKNVDYGTIGENVTDIATYIEQIYEIMSGNGNIPYIITNESKKPVDVTYDPTKINTYIVPEKTAIGTGNTTVNNTTNNNILVNNANANGIENILNATTNNPES